VLSLKGPPYAKGFAVEQLSFDRISLGKRANRTNESLLLAMAATASLAVGPIGF
jgi:hypothetical protein